MEGIGDGNFIGDGFGAAASGFGFGGFFQFTAVGVGNVINFGLIGQRGEKPLAQNVVNFVGGQVYRGDIAFLAA